MSRQPSDYNKPGISGINSTVSSSSSSKHVRTEHHHHYQQQHHNLAGRGTNSSAVPRRGSSAGLGGQAATVAGDGHVTNSDYQSPYPTVNSNSNNLATVNGANFVNNANYANFNALSHQISRLDIMGASTNCGGGGSKLKPSHTAALNQIKQSLLPYDSSWTNHNSQSNTDTLSSESSSGTTSSQSEFGKEISMLESLIEMGFQKDSAYYALKLTQFSSLQDAVNVLVKINSSHVYGPHLQRKASFENTDASSSRSESPMQQQMPQCPPSLQQQQQQQRMPAMHQFRGGGGQQQQQQQQNHPFLCAANVTPTSANQRTPSPMMAQPCGGGRQSASLIGGGDSSKKCHVTVNDADNNNAASSSVTPLVDFGGGGGAVGQQPPVFVRQAILPVLPQTVLSRKVEKPVAQNVEPPQFKQQQQHQQSSVNKNFYISDVNMNVNPTANKSRPANIIDVGVPLSVKSHVMIDETNSAGYNMPTVEDQRMAGPSRIVLSGGALAGVGINVANNANSPLCPPPHSAPSSSSADSAYLEHLMQRVSDVLNVRGGNNAGGGPVGVTSPLHNFQPLGLRKRDSAASSSSDNSSGPPLLGNENYVTPTASGAIVGMRYNQQQQHYVTNMLSSTGFGQSGGLTGVPSSANAVGGVPPMSSNTFVSPPQPQHQDIVDPNGNFDPASYPTSAMPTTSNGGVQRSESPLPDSIRNRLLGLANQDSSPSSSAISNSAHRQQQHQKFAYKPCTPQAFKFFMEQHVENVIKQHKARQRRLLDLEKEIQRGGFSSIAQCHLRKMLKYKESQYLRLKRQKMDASHFTKIQTIGVGAFGEVTLVVKNDTRGLYAMKTLRKSDVIKKNQAAHVKAERDILSEADNEWVVKLYYSFQDKDNLFFILEYIPGGDMMALLIKKGIFEEDLAKFYIAELVCAIESVHKLNFIHRDIKPDNILIDEKGHIKLTDFGLCTGLRWTHDWKRYTEQPEKSGHVHQDSFDLLQMREPTGDHKILDFRQQKPRHKAHSLVGTPNYIAPEVLLRIGHTQLCDWWSVGVILYEMVVGHPPFLANSPEETQLKVIHWKDTLYIPGDASLSYEVRDLIAGLCRGHEDRLGRVNGAADIKKHSFFKGIDWPNLRKMKAPYRPQILHETDTSNFDPVEPRSEPPPSKDTPHNANNNGGGQQLVGGHQQSSLPDHAFYEFTFRRFFLSDGYGCPQSRLDPVMEPADETSSLLPTGEYTSESPKNHVTATGFATSQSDRTGFSDHVTSRQRLNAAATGHVNVLRVNSEEEDADANERYYYEQNYRNNNNSNENGGGKFAYHHFYDSSSSGTIVDDSCCGGSTNYLHGIGSGGSANSDGNAVAVTDETAVPTAHILAEQQATKYQQQTQSTVKKAGPRDRSIVSIDSVYV